MAAVNGLRLSQGTSLPGLGSPPALSQDSTISPAEGEGAGEFSESRGRVFSVPASKLFLLTAMEPIGYTGRWGSTSSSHKINTLKHVGVRGGGVRHTPRRSMQEPVRASPISGWGPCGQRALEDGSKQRDCSWTPWTVQWGLLLATAQ